MRKYKFRLGGFELSGFELAAFALSAFLLTACAPNTGTQSSNKTVSGSTLGGSSSMIPLGGSDTSGGSSTGSTGSTGSSGQIVQTQAPFNYNVFGMGNHAAYLCVPAQSKLILRVKPHANSAPLLPANPNLINQKTGKPLYDGSPAAYTKLRIRVSIPGTAAAWDYQTSVETWSVSGDYSSYLKAVSPTNVTPTSALATPEYPNTQIIYGSNPSDGLCTFWESQLHGCALSSSLRTAEAAGCPQGQQKLMITNIVSDYPCSNDTVGWCQGGSVQTVPDYQQWNATIEVQTENTSGL